MNGKEVQVLLGAAAAIDSTVPAPGRQVIEMWTAVLDDVPFEAGQVAVRDYYRSSEYLQHKRTITPSDIYGHYRATRRDELEREHSRHVAEDRAAIANPPAAIRSLAAEFAAQKATARGDDPGEARRDAEYRQRILAVPCPHQRCRAGRGQRCTSFTGRPLQRTVAHPSRIEAAGIAAESQ